VMAFIPNSPLSTSTEEPRLAHRTFDARITTNRLSFSGTILSFTAQDDPATFASYTFAFHETQFTPLPDTSAVAAFQEQFGVEHPVQSTVDIDSCIETRPDTIATADGTSLIFPTLCRINATAEGEAPGMIGVIFPADNTIPLRDGDATCREEIAYWRTLPGFADIGIVICAVVDRPFDPNGRAQNWMDVIAYQHVDGALFTMRAESRNFLRIQ